MTAVPPPSSDIDPSEALIVVTGMGPFLRHTSRDLSGAIVRSEGLNDAIEAQIYRFMGRTEPAETPKPPEFDYEEAVGLLDDSPKDGQIGKTMAAFGDSHTLGMDVGTQVTRIATYLRQQIPRRTRVGMAGPEDLPPPRSEELRFRLCWHTAMEPMSLFDDLQAFAMSRGQLGCFAQMFPTTAKQLWPMVQRMMVRKRTQVEGWQPARRQEVLLRVLGGQEAPLQALGQALVSVYAQEQQTQAAQQKQQPSSRDVSQADEGTPIQRLDAAT